MAILLKSLFLIFTFWIGLSTGQSGCNDPSDCLCLNGYYYNSSDNDYMTNTIMNDCDCPICNITSSLIDESGTLDDCMPCDQSCDTCFGSESNQCHTCNGPYIVLVRGIQDGEIVCENNTIRNASLDVVQCVDNCTNGYTQDNTTSECICNTRQGHFLNDSQCMECIRGCTECINGTYAGCLRCTVARYEGGCVEVCPPGTLLENGICEKEDERFSFTTIIAVIAGIAGLALVCFILIATLLCYFICRSRYKRKHYDANDYHEPRSKASVVISESFKKVTLRKDNKVKSMNRDISNASVIHSMRDSFDPYSASRPSIQDVPAINKPSITEEQDEYEETGVGGKTRESVYIEMSPATSQENLENSGILLVGGGKQYRKVGPSLSFQSPGERPQYPHPTDARKSLPPVGSYSETYEEMTVFSNSQHLPGNSQDEEEEHEMYEDLSVGPLVPVISPHSQHPPRTSQDEEDEQEVYEDLSAGPLVPVIPPRGMKPPQRTSQGKRKETLDNEYVKIVKQKPHPGQQHNNQLERSSRSTKNLLEEPKYINVSRSGDHRLRSVTSPSMEPATPNRSTLIDDDNDDLPEYENWNIHDRHPQEEIYY